MSELRPQPFEVTDELPTKKDVQQQLAKLAVEHITHMHQNEHREKEEIRNKLVVRKGNAQGTFP